MEELLDKLMEAISAADGEMYKEAVTELLTRDNTMLMVIDNIATGNVSQYKAQAYAKLVVEELTK